MSWSCSEDTHSSVTLYTPPAVFPRPHETRMTYSWIRDKQEGCANIADLQQRCRQVSFEGTQKSAPIHTVRHLGYSRCCCDSKEEWFFCFYNYMRGYVQPRRDFSCCGFLVEVSQVFFIATCIRARYRDSWPLLLRYRDVNCITTNCC